MGKLDSSFIVVSTDEKAPLSALDHTYKWRKIMSLEERAKATAKNVEGKVQDAMGQVTGDVGDQAEGKAKQVEASARHAKEDVKDNLKQDVDKV
jgi:uncharacterized protein YjbJ (UPF0337 family)